MLNNFIYAKTKDLFLKELEASNVLDEAIVFIEDTKEIWNHGTYFANNTLNINYSDLVTLRNNSQLVPGMFYRSTDYVTTTSLENTKSAYHPFDIIVLALTKNTLSEDAKAILHEGDTYFADSDLSVWELKYCLDNDKTRFEWAAETLVIENYRIKPELIDGYSFIEPFPFEGQILIDTSEFVYDSGRAGDIIYEWGYETEPNGETNLYIIKNGEGYENEGLDYNDRYYYRGTINIEGEIYDKWEKYEIASNNYYISDAGAVYFLTKSIIEEVLLTMEGKGVIYYMKDEYNNECPYDFKNIMFYEENEGRNFYTFSFINDFDQIEDLTLRQDLLDDAGDCRGTHHNIIKPCYLQLFSTLTQTLNKNIFMFSNENSDGYSGCYNIIFNINSRNNLIYCNGCSSNTFGEKCENNIFEEGCCDNIFGNSCYNNIFGNGCYNNIFGNFCANNTFGNECESNIFGNDCVNNIFGDLFLWNTLGNYCSDNTFGDFWYANSLGNYCRANLLGNSYYNNTFGSNCFNINFYDSEAYIYYPDEAYSRFVGVDALLSNVQNCKLGDHCENLLIYLSRGNAENGVQNLNIAQGLSSTIESEEYNAFKLLSIEIPVHSQEYELKVAKNSKGEVKVYCEADLIG